MRWDTQSIDRVGEQALPGLTLPGLTAQGLVRTVRTPEFAGVTFHEVLARSALNRIPAASQVPFRWTVNPYRGCTHGCVYCFARGTHTYLGLDSGADFDAQIVVKINVADVLRREVNKPTWQRERVALGTNTDPYQRCEGRYRLMPGIISALTEAGTPFSILTKGTLLRRDLPTLAAAARSVSVELGVSLALVDETIRSQLEPGAPGPRSRLELIRSIVDAGLHCNVLVAPVLPLITDSDDALDALLHVVADAGATRASVMALHLRPGAREWFFRYLVQHHPALAPRYAELYRSGSYVEREYALDLARRAGRLLRRHRLGETRATSR